MHSGSIQRKTFTAAQNGHRKTKTMKNKFTFGALLVAATATMLSQGANAQTVLDYNAWISANNRETPYNDFSVNTNNRASVVTLWKQVYRPTTGTPLGWTGNVASGNAGTISDTFKWGAVSRLNYYRAMAGLGTRITLDQTWSQKDQAAALCMAAAQQVSHTITSSWPFYTTDAAAAALAGNLGPAFADPAVIDGWFLDDGGSATNDPSTNGNNWQVGHRRQLLSVGAATFGIGMTATPNGYNVAVAGCNTNTGYSNAPAPRDEFIAWPAPGFVPYKVVYPRWSIEWPAPIIQSKYGGNLHMDTDTTVTVTRNGQAVPVYSESLAYEDYGTKLTFTLLGCATGGDYDNATLPQLMVGIPNIATAQTSNPTLDEAGKKTQVLDYLDNIATPRFDYYPAVGTSGTLSELSLPSNRTLPDSTYHVKIANVHTNGTATTGTDAYGTYTYYVSEQLRTVEYDVTIIDPDAPTATAPVIVQQPVAKSGPSVTLAVGVSGGTIISGVAPSYQWYKGTSGNTGSPVTGGTASYLTVTPTSDSYWVRVTNTLGSVDSESVSSLAPVAVTTAPTGGHFSPLYPPTLTVAATGGGTLSYQWAKNGTPILGATSASYKPQAGLDASYSVTVTNGYTSASSSATVTWVQPPSAVSLSTTFATTVGAPITAYCSGENLRYQWYVLTLASMRWTPAGNGPTITAMPPAVKKGASFAFYYCVVSNDAGSQSSQLAIAMGAKAKKKKK